MCGIAGIYNLRSGQSIDQKKFEHSLLSMGYRGPNANGIKVFESTAVFGHLRLSIIDLQKENNQPFQLDERYWIVFNGEIYNYLELRQELKELGCQFRTSGDTEVLLRSYQMWGEDCVNKFNGMWSFAIYDTQTKKLFCSRDRFGIKPFNYAEVNGQFIFASEIKSIINYFPKLRVPDYNVIANYCRKSTGAQIKQTWFKNIFRLEAAHNLIIENSQIKVYRYWDYPRKVNKGVKFNDAVETYKSLLRDSIRLRMRSDVPVGFTLSSGIDSTSLVCLLKDQFKGNKNTYTAAFQNTEFHTLEKQSFKAELEINEPALVKELTLGLDLTPSIIEIDYNSYTDRLRKIIYHLESGHSSPAVLPLYQILEKAKKEVTVVLEGQGADEMLGGYIVSSMPIYLLELLSKFKIKKAVKELRIFIKSYSFKVAFMTMVRQSNLSIVKSLFYRLSHLDSFYSGNLKKHTEIKDYPFEAKGFDSLLNKLLFKSHTGTLIDLLHYGDAISMAHSLESRLPFMDYRLIEFAFTLPSDFKIKNGMGKYIHRQAMRNVVPNFILDNPIKFGFDSPLSHIFNGNDHGSPKSILLSEKCLNRGLFSKKALIKSFDEQFYGKKNHARLLYRLLSVELWFREFIDDKN